MSKHVTGTIENTSWAEQPAVETEGGRRLARGTMTEVFHGGIEGQGAVEALLAYRDDTRAELVGFERLVGRVGDRSGSFVLQFGGAIDGRTAQVAWNVVPGSATGELSGLTGRGGYTWDGQTVCYTLDYEFG